MGVVVSPVSQVSSQAGMKIKSKWSECLSQIPTLFT